MVATHPHTYTDWLREHPWAQILDPRSSANLEWRWERSRNLAEFGVTGCGLDTAGNREFQVNSESDSNRHYHVTLERGCDCPDGRLAGRASLGWCKHRFAAWTWWTNFTAESKGG